MLSAWLPARLPAMAGARAADTPGWEGRGSNIHTCQTSVTGVAQHGSACLHGLAFIIFYEWTDDEQSDTLLTGG